MCPQFDKFENATAGDKAFDMGSADMAVKLTVGCLEFVFVNKFLQRLLVGFVGVCPWLEKKIVYLRCIAKKSALLSSFPISLNFLLRSHPRS